MVLVQIPHTPPAVRNDNNGPGSDSSHASGGSE